MIILHDKLPNPIQKVGEYQVVKTPVALAEQVLDCFPAEVWSKANKRWLAPVSKTGVFEVAIYSRLMKGLTKAIPNWEERRAWIIREMIWSFVGTSACELIVRRSYLGKVWDKPRGFEELDGNVSLFNLLKATIDKEGRVMAKKNGKEEFVKFDYIVGNPPYQDNPANGRSDPKNIYPDFVLKAIEAKPDYMSMVIPARWMSGSGKGIAPFLKMMIECKKIAKIVSTEDSKEWFPDVGIGGGTMYFLYDQSKASSTININGTDIDLIGEETISTNSISPNIRSKVLAKSKTMFGDVMLGRNPYGITSNFDAWTDSANNAYICHCRGRKTNLVSKENVVRHTDTLSKYRVCVPNGGAEGISYVFVIPPAQVCSETYLVMASFESERDAKNAEAFFRTKFAQYIISCLKRTQHLSKRVFAWLPYLDFTRSYTDQDLYTMFALSPEEIAHIETTTKDFPIFRAKRNEKKAA